MYVYVYIYKGYFICVVFLGGEVATAQRIEWQGSHVVLREFEYVNATPRNRMSFVRVFVEDNRSLVRLQGYLAHQKNPPIGPYSSICLGSYGGPRGGGVLVSEVPLYVNATPRNRMSFVRIFVEDNRSEMVV